MNDKNVHFWLAAGDGPIQSVSSKTAAPAPAEHAVPYGDLHQRLGRFTLDAGALRENPEAFFPLFARCIVVRCEHLFWGNQIEYTAMCAEFDVVPEGQVPDYYDLQVTCHAAENSTRSYSYEWVKLQPVKTAPAADLADVLARTIKREIQKQYEPGGLLHTAHAAGTGEPPCDVEAAP